MAIGSTSAIEFVSSSTRRLLSFAAAGRLPRRHRRPTRRSRASTALRGAAESLEDRTMLSPQLLLDIRPGTLSSVPGPFVDINGTAYFTANDGQNAFELWKSNGTAAG